MNLRCTHARSTSDESAHERKEVASWIAGPSSAASIDDMPTCSVLMTDGCWATSFQLYNRATFILMSPIPKTAISNQISQTFSHRLALESETNR